MPQANEILILFIFTQFFVCFSISKPLFGEFEGKVEFTSTQESRKIFFVVTSEEKVLRARYNCAITSAHSQNPSHEILVYSNHLEETQFFGLERVAVVRYDLKTVFEGTPLEGWDYEREDYKENLVNNLSNAIRLALVYKEGGIYMDFDVLSVSPFNLSNCVSLQNDGKICNAVFSFDKGHPFLLLCMKSFVQGSKYKP